MTYARLKTWRNTNAGLRLLAVAALTVSWSEPARADGTSANPPAIPAPTTVQVDHPNMGSFPLEPPASTENPPAVTKTSSSSADLASSAPVQTAQPVQTAPPIAVEPTAPLASGTAHSEVAPSSATPQSTPRTTDANTSPEQLPGFARTFPNQNDQGVLPASRQHEGLRQLGMTFDVGVPDGAILGIAYRPAFWTRLQAGAGTNAVSPGMRAGASIVPFGSGPSLTLEGGWYFEGDANSVIGKVAGSHYSNSRTGERIGYQFANLHLGLDFGSKYSTFYMHGGMTYLHTSLHDASDAFGGQTVGSDGSVTTYTFNQDLSLNAFFPSFKLGIIVYIV